MSQEKMILPEEDCQPLTRLYDGRSHKVEAGYLWSKFISQKGKTLLFYRAMGIPTQDFTMACK
jgi:hypothetical protein